MKHRLATKIIFILTCCCLAFSCHKEKVDDCIGTPTNTNCPAVYIPVCGCNGQTYSNSCEAASAGVKRWANGPCSAH